MALSVSKQRLPEEAITVPGLDAVLFRAIKLQERWSLQFRAECFNVVNTPDLSDLGTHVSTLQVNSNGTLMVFQF